MWGVMEKSLHFKVMLIMPKFNCEHFRLRNKSRLRVNSTEYIARLLSQMPKLAIVKLPEFHKKDHG